MQNKDDGQIINYNGLLLNEHCLSHSTKAFIKKYNFYMLLHLKIQIFTGPGIK